MPRRARIDYPGAGFLRNVPNSSKKLSFTMKILILFLPIIYLLSYSTSHADTLTLTNGHKLVGIIISETETHVRLKNENYEIQIKKDDIKDIVKEEYSASKKVIKSPSTRDHLDGHSNPAPKIKTVKKGTFGSNKGKKNEKPDIDKKGLTVITVKEKNTHVYVPTNYSHDQAWPLIFGFHWAHGNGRDYIELWTKAAERYEYIIVCPDAAGNFWHLNPDYKYLTNILQYMRKHYNIDSNKLYACGFSNGGGFVYRVASQLGQELAGIASMGFRLESGVNLAVKRMKKDTKIYILNGELDPNFPPASGQKAAKYFRKHGFKNVKFISAGGIGHVQPSSVAFKIMQYFDESGIVTE